MADILPSPRPADNGHRIGYSGRSLRRVAVRRRRGGRTAFVDRRRRP